MRLFCFAVWAAAEALQPSFHCTFQSSHTFASLPFFLLSLSLLSLCVQAPGGEIDEGLSAQATLKRSIAWWLWCLSCGCALRALPRWQSATENAADAIPEPCTTVDWSIGHRVKCSPRERGWGWRLRRKKKEEVVGAGRGAENIRRDNFGINAQSLTLL